jgi:phosphoglycerate kinase
MILRPQTIDSVAFEGKRVFVRVDFNVPLKDGVIGDDTRIRAALPTLRTILQAGGSVVAASHLGRPKGMVVEALRMAPVATRLQELLGSDFEVMTVPEVRGEAASTAAQQLQPGQLLLLENLRFEPGETQNDSSLAQDLANLADLFVQDAFGTCHRAHASTAGVPGLLKPAVAGLLLQKEIEAFSMALAQPEHPVVAVIGGAKVSDKILVLEQLISKVDCILIGGGMAYTFLKAQGQAIGDSLFEEDRLETACAILEKASEQGVEIFLPSDHVVAEQFSAQAPAKIVEGEIKHGWMGLDIGPATRAQYRQKLEQAATVVWNGPMGVFEWEPFSVGTTEIAQVLAQTDNVSVVGGGDSVAAINKNGVQKQITHISTGGGAFLEMLEGKDLPGIAALDPVP